MLWKLIAASDTHSLDFCLRVAQEMTQAISSPPLFSLLQFQAEFLARETRKYEKDIETFDGCFRARESQIYIRTARLNRKGLRIYNAKIYTNYLRRPNTFSSVSRRLRTYRFNIPSYRRKKTHSVRRLNYLQPILPLLPRRFFRARCV